MQTLADGIDITPFLMSLSITLGGGEKNSRLTGRYLIDAVQYISLGSILRVREIDHYDFSFPVASYSRRLDGSVTVTGAGLRVARLLPSSLSRSSLSAIAKTIDPLTRIPLTTPNSIVIAGNLSTAKVLDRLAKQSGLMVTDTGSRLIIRDVGNIVDVVVINETKDMTPEGLKTQITIPLQAALLPGDVINGYTADEIEHDITGHTTTITA